MASAQRWPPILSRQPLGWLIDDTPLNLGEGHLADGHHDLIAGSGRQCRGVLNAAAPAGRAVRPAVSSCYVPADRNSGKRNQCQFVQSAPVPAAMLLVLPGAALKVWMASAGAPVGSPEQAAESSYAISAPCRPSKALAILLQAEKLPGVEIYPPCSEAAARRRRVCVSFIDFAPELKDGLSFPRFGRRAAGGAEGAI